MNKPALKLPTPTLSDPVGQLPLNRRILVVDDEPGVLDAYYDILQPRAKVTPLRSSRKKAEPNQTTVLQENIETFELVKASSGEEAIGFVKQALQEGRPFAMGFFDVLLGKGIDGIEVVRQIHTIDPQMYAVLVTAYQDRHVDSIQEVFGIQFQDRWDYLNKPFTEGEIRQKARNMVSMWNMRLRNQLQQESIRDLRQRITSNEKMIAIATVARRIGHEFGNILLQIMGRADLSRKGSPEEMSKALETILLATEHASKILDRFKNMAQPFEAIQKFEPVRLQDIIMDTLTFIEHELSQRSIDININLKDIPQISAAPNSLVQVFLNLLINAIHAINHNGSIEISGHVVGSSVEITIHDSGPGLSNEQLQHLFQPFFTTKGNQGTGLGLSICRQIIEDLHGGELKAANHPSGGAIFTVLIPIKPEVEEEMNP